VFKNAPIPRKKHLKESTQELKLEKLSKSQLEYLQTDLIANTKKQGFLSGKLFYSPTEAFASQEAGENKRIMHKTNFM